MTTARRQGFAVLAAGLLALTGCTAAGGGGDGNGDGAAAGCAEPSGGGRISIATGNTTGVYYILGGGLAQVITDTVEGTEATAEATNASAENIQLVCAGESDIGFTLADTAADAVNGTADFEGDAITSCALGRLYDNYTQIVTSADSGITSIEEMEGMSVSLGSPGSGTEIIALRILEAAGLDPDSDISRQQLGVTETVEALRDGTIAAVATDHAPHARHEKEVPFEAAPFGVTGLETAFAALHTHLVEPGLIPLETLLERMSAGPARAFGLPEPKLEVGARANLVLLDLTAEWIVTEEGFRSRSANSWLLGQRLHGRVVTTVADGRLVYG